MNVVRIGPDAYKPQLTQQIPISNQFNELNFPMLTLPKRRRRRKINPLLSCEYTNLDLLSNRSAMRHIIL